MEWNTCTSSSRRSRLRRRSRERMMSGERAPLRRTALTLMAASLAAIATLAGASTLRAQGSTVARIDRYVAIEMARQHIPGIAVGIYKDGKIAMVKGYGLSNVELNVPVKPATIFQSGSVGK